MASDGPAETRAEATPAERDVSPGPDHPDAGMLTDTMVSPPPDRPAEAAGPVEAGRAEGAVSLLPEILGRIDRADLEARFAMLQEISQPNRVTGSAAYLRAAEWIRDLVLAGAPAARVQLELSNGYRNVEIVLPGSDPGAGVIVVGGHLDSVARSPGMDDNASGSLGAALVARALGPYRFRSELRFVLFDAEEEGLIGSAIYARDLLASGCLPGTCLKFFLNMDMIGHDPQRTSRVEVFTPRQDLFDLLAASTRDQGLGLMLARGGNRGCNGSDDCSFASRGYDTIYLFEAVYLPQRHTPADTIALLNFDTLTRTLQLVAVAVAQAADLQGRR